MTVYRCNLCVGFLAVSLRLLLNHLGRNHRNDPNFHLLCGINGCARTYRSFYSFRNHVVNKHADLFNINKHAVPDTDGHIEEGLDLVHAQPDGLNAACDHQYFAVFDCEKEKQEMARSNATCILKFKEEGRVPQTVVNSFVKNTIHIVQNSIGAIKRGVKAKLQAAGLDFDTIPGLGED